MKVLLKIAYVGTDYCGYQVQKNGITVQEMLNKAASAVFGTECDIVGCSRTDSGVHARGFMAAVNRKGFPFLDTAIPVERIPQALNAHLPEDISVLEASFVPDTFHPRYDVVAKEYEYLILNSHARNPFLRDRAWQLHSILSEDDVKRMNEAAQFFVGKKDFSAFRDSGADTDEKDAEREVFSASVTKEGNLISYRVRANGFLYHMVRIMAGTLVEVGKGKISPHEVLALISAGDRTRMGATAPAEGLYLDKVFY